MKLKTVIVLALLLGTVTGGGIFAYFKDRAEWKRKVEETEASLQAARDSVSLYRTERDSIGQAADSTINAKELEVDSLRRSERIWKNETRRTRATLTVVLEGVEDSTAEQINSVVDNLEAQHEERVKSLQEALAAKDTIIEEWKAKWEAEKRLNRQLQIALENAEDQVAVWQREAQPNLFEKYTDNWIVGVTGVVVGIVIDRWLLPHGGDEIILVQDEWPSHQSSY